MEIAAPDVADAEAQRKTLPADPTVKNFSYTVVDGEIYYRENSIMTQIELSDNAKGRVAGMVELRQIVNELIDQQLNDFPDEDIKASQAKLNAAYDAFTAKYGLINDKKNARLFDDDSSYYLLCSLENLDENKNLKSKADMFTKRTIRPERVVTSVDTPSEALAVSIGEHGKVDLPYMAELLGTPGNCERITTELSGVIFKDPAADADDPEAGWQTADEYLSGNVRDKLRMAQLAAESHPEFKVNVDALTKAQPKDLEASEIDVRLGATWLAPSIVQQFMMETFQPPYRIRYNNAITVRYSPYTSEWRISNKSATGFGDIMATETYGTRRANAYKILEDTLNLRDSRVYDTIEEDGKEKRVLNQNETTLAQQKQQAIKDAFAGWVWKDPQRRALLVKKYNELFNSTRPREYDGSHIHFVGMNPEINLREHQRNAVAHVLYGYNTLLAHEVGAGKSFEMAASAMELKRLGLCQKSLFVVPNHLTEQWASEFLRLYPHAKLLVTSKKDFEPGNRKKFCARIATGDYDAVIIGHSQFEKIPLSAERQERLIQEQMDEIEEAIEEAKAQVGEHFTVKQLEKLRKSLKQKLKKLQGADRKDDVVTFEQLGVDRLFVDESQMFEVEIDRRPMTKKTMREYNLFIRSVLNYANDNYGTSLQMPMIKASGRKGKSVDCLHSDEVEALQAALQECSMLEKAIVLCLLNTGVRRGELAGLTWKDVNFREGTIHVSKSLLVFPNYGYQLTTTKESNIRDVDVAPEFMDFLKDYYAQWKAQKKLMGASWQKNLEKKGSKYAQSLLDLRGNDFVICNDYGFPINPDSYGALVRRVGKKAGIEKIHPHMFRHTFVSILLSNPNIGVATVAAEAGHAQPSTTLAIYTQVYDRRRDEIRKQMSRELYK